MTLRRLRRTLDHGALAPAVRLGQHTAMLTTLRFAELLGALSLATDLGMGQPLEHALRTCLVALQLGDRLGLRPAELSDVYHVALLSARTAGLASSITLHSALRRRA